MLRIRIRSQTVIVILVGIVSFLWMAILLVNTIYLTTTSITFTDYLSAMIILAIALFTIVAAISIRMYLTEKDLKKLEEKYIKTL
jgi:small basic protein